MCGERLQQRGTRERRRVTVLFIDLTSFTTLTLGFDPEELRDLADEVLTVVAGVIEDFDGYVDAFQGDGLIALFGAPSSHPDDPQRAVLAAYAALRSIESIGRAKGYPLKGRAGVNTGTVIAGTVGSARSRDYTVMGSTVNLAARLEAAAIPGEVWVGPDTYEATRHVLVYEPSPPVSLAGFPNVRTAYRLVSPLHEYDSDPYGYVGREAQLAQLRRNFREAVAAGSERPVWVYGGPGMGKTRLLREFQKELEDVRVLWLGGVPGAGPAWRQLAKQLFDLHEGEDSRVAQQRSLLALQELLPGEKAVHEAVIASLGLTSPDDSFTTGLGSNLPPRATGGAAEDEAGARLPATLLAAMTPVEAWAHVLRAVTHAAPNGATLLIDMRVANPGLRELLKRLSGLKAPLLVVKASRQEPPPGLPVTAIELPPLDRDAALELLDQLVGPKFRAAAHTFVDQVSGVPAHLIELGRSLSSAQPGTVAGSMASLLQARLDLLSHDERQMLTVAALTGERSWERLLLDLCEGDELSLKRLLRENLLVREQSSDIPGTVAYRFQSDLLRHAVLRMVPFGDQIGRAHV